MQKEQKALKANFFKNLIIATVVMIVIVACVIILKIAEIPIWPFVFFTFYYTSIAKMEKGKFLQTSIGGFIGMTAGFSQSFITFVTNNEMAGLIGFLILVTVLIALMIDERVKVVETFCMFMVTVLTGFVDGLPINQYIGCIASYLIAVALFAVISLVMSKRQGTKNGSTNRL